MREGWRPVKASSLTSLSLPIIQHDSLGEGDYIGAEDLILMEMPERVARQRERFYKRKQARQTGAVERQVKGVHSESHIGFGPISNRGTHSRVKVSGVVTPSPVIIREHHVIPPYGASHHFYYGRSWHHPHVRFHARF